MSGSKIMQSAAALLAFTGMAHASAIMAPHAPYPRAANTNTTLGPTAYHTTPSTITPTGVYTTTSASPSATGNPDSAFCPAFDLQVIVDGFGIEFLIECNTNHFGTFLEIDITLAKRATPASLNDCLATCDTDSLCVAASFNKVTDTCEFFKTVGASYTDPNVDFAMKVGAADETVTSPPVGSPTVTGTIIQTAIATIYSCAATVTDCPYADRGEALVTETVSLYTTYCPGNADTTTTVDAAALAGCGCKASAMTVTVYSPTVATFSALSTTSTVYVPVKTNVLNYPAGAGTAASTVATTTISGAAATSVASVIGADNAAASGVASGTGAAPASTLAAFTGAAGHVEAGMGLAGFAAIMAFML